MARAPQADPCPAAVRSLLSLNMPAAPPLPPGTPNQHARLGVLHELACWRAGVLALSVRGAHRARVVLSTADGAVLAHGMPAHGMPAHGMPAGGERPDVGSEQPANEFAEVRGHPLPCASTRLRG